MKKQFAGKVAVVTGGTQGLGEAIARLFAERGAAGLVICGRNKERGKAVADDLSQGGCKTISSRPTLPTSTPAGRSSPRPTKAFGRVDVLVNAAAITDRGTILDTSPELFDAMFAVNVRAPFFLMQDAAKIMIRERIEGAMVNILSMAGAWRAALHHRLLRLEGRARDADQERRLLAAAGTASASTASTSAGWIRPASTASRRAITTRRDDWLDAGGGRAAVRPAAEADRGGARRRLSGERRIRA